MSDDTKETIINVLLIAATVLTALIKKP